jgi:tetratricopeptide (TPR) repeat protein
MRNAIHTSICSACLLAAALTIAPGLASIARADPTPSPTGPDRGSETTAATQATTSKPFRTEYQEELAAQHRTLRRRIARYLQRASQLMLAEKYDEAGKLLARLGPRRLSAYERALVYRTQAYVAYGQGNQAGAVALLRKSLDEDILSRQDTADVLFRIAQLQSIQREWPQVVETMQEWFQTTANPGPQGYYQLGLAYFELKNFDTALEPARKAVEIAEIPQQSWLQLLLAVHLNRREYAAATPVLMNLLTQYPDMGASYWLQLSALYGIQQDIPRALAVLEVAHRKGVVTEDRDLRRLAQLSQAQDMPIRAVAVLEEGLANRQIEPDVGAYELLANSWVLARESEKGEDALEHAAQLAPKGDLYLRLAQVMLQNEQWKQAAVALQSAVAKGGLEDPSNADLLLGIAYYKEDRLADARRSFDRARQGDKTRASANAWIEQVDHQLRTGRGRATSIG